MRQSFLRNICGLYEGSGFEFRASWLRLLGVRTERLRFGLWGVWLTVAMAVSSRTLYSEP